MDGEEISVIQTQFEKPPFLACENPDTAIMVMNMPGVGNSGMLPESVRKEIRKTGSYGSLGEYVGSVIDHVAKDFDEV